MFVNVYIYIKDMPERNRIQNGDEIIASSIDIFTNSTRVSNTFKSERSINYSNKTISKHMGYLAKIFLISKADRYDIKGRKYIGTNLKY